jgi:C-terminal processing protease CtpA/Prc
MRFPRWTTLAAMIALLPGCGGGSDAGGTTAVGTATPTPTATTAAGCALRERQDWVAAQLREWYLFPETLPASLDPTPYTTLGGYVDALTATARSQRRDRYFTYVTSIADENAYYASGATAGFGIRLSYDATAGRAFVTEAFEGAPALAAGIDRGAEILAIGTSASDLRTVASIIAAEGTAGVTNALGPNTAGTTRLLRISDAAGTRDVAVAKTDYSLVPVSSRYGARVLSDNGRSVGYLNLRTFISTADDQLRTAFAQFKAAGVSDVIVDLRYNGGGLVATSELFADLLAANRSTSEVLSYTTFRSEKSSNNSTRLFRPQSQSIAPTRIAFIGSGGTASASELLINAFVPYLGAKDGLIGSNTYGKPVGQIALDRTACDDRLRVIAFATQNANRQGDYYSGLAGTVQASCAGTDDLAHPLGDARETLVARAIDFLDGRSCTPISTDATTSSASAGRRELLVPDRPTTAQRETPGLF